MSTSSGSLQLPKLNSAEDSDNARKYQQFRHYSGGSRVCEREKEKRKKESENQRTKMKIVRGVAELNIRNKNGTLLVLIAVNRKQFAGRDTSARKEREGGKPLSPPHSLVFLSAEVLRSEVDVKCGSIQST